MSLQETISTFIILFMVLHTFALVLYNKYRIRQMLYRLGLCRGRELTEKDYVALLDEYTSFLGYASFSPNRQAYPALYTNPAFAAFAQRSKRIMQYFAGTMTVGLLASLLVSLFQH